MNRLLPALLLLLAAGSLRAALPDAVRRACFSAAVTERSSGQTWDVTSWETWRGAPLRIAEVGADTIAEQDGKPSPAGWAKTTVALLMPPQTEANPQPTQRLTLTVTPTGTLPKASFDLLLLRDAPLPPCSVKAWGGRLAIVSDAGDWYIAADDPKARVTVAEGPERRTTVKVEGLTPQDLKPVSAALLVGEGPLPTPPPLPEAKPAAPAAPKKPATPAR